MHKTIKINGVEYSLNNLDELTVNFNSTQGWLPTLKSFLKDWFSGCNQFMVHTSGSTGEPKPIMVSRKAFIASAQRTISFFSLKPGQSVLLCLPIGFIAGKMMIVRALVGGLNLIPVEPSGFPLQTVTNPVDFAAFTPMQMMNELSRTSDSKLHLLRKVIIGGGIVSSGLDNLLKEQTFEVWETYGMTETLTHIALRKINGNNPQKSFFPLPDIDISADYRGCLVIRNPEFLDGKVVTNDFADIQSDGSFRITGRWDNVINSGGVKIQPEKIEAALAEIYSDEVYASSVSNNLLGNQLVLVVNKQPENPQLLFSMLEDKLPRHHIPASLYVVNEFPKTVSGKINRLELKECINGIQPIYERKKLP